MIAKCNICPKKCIRQEGELGFCKARKATKGRMISSNYGQITSMGMDPIEKKPLYRFMPGSQILSVGSYGCNLRCDFCQNYSISFCDGSNIRKIYIEPEDLAKKAEELIPMGNIGIAYTYNEPLIGYEYVIDTGKIIQEKGMKNILVTNGYIYEEYLRKVLPFIDAMNIDLKSFSNAEYRRLSGDLDTVLNSIKVSNEYTHVELTTLIVPGRNDKKEEMEEIARWIASVNPEIPLHISRFFPAYKMHDSSPTPVSTIYEFVDIAKKYLKYAYPGNC